MKIGPKAKLLALVFLFLVIIIGAGFWLWSWWQRKNAPFACPVPWSYCRRARVVQLPTGEPAIGFTVPEGTTVWAVASGLVKQGAYRREDGKVEQTIFLDLANGERLVYSFVGESLVQMQQVAAGQPIGRIKAKDEAVKGANANLVIYYRDAEKQIRPINSRDFRRAE